MKNEIKERLTETIQFLVLIIAMIIFMPFWAVEGCTIFYFEWLIWGRKSLLTWQLYFKILEKFCIKIIS